jgi:phage-related minor tail protein
VPLGPHGEVPKNFDDLYSGKSSFPQFAGGVQNFSGGLALVGEKGPELVNLPSGSDVIPNSRMGGGGVSITVHVTQPFGTPEAIARAVADAQVSLMRGQGVRLPYGT